MKKGLMVLIVVMFIVLIGSVWAEEKSITKQTRKSAQEVLEESKRIHEMRRQHFRSKLSFLVEQLKKEKDLEKRKDIVIDLGRTEDTRAIKSLLEILQDDTESKEIRGKSAESLYVISITEDRNNELEKQIKEVIIPTLKRIYERGKDELKRELVSTLYRIGEKEITKPIIFKYLKKGEWGILNIFYYYSKIGNIMTRSTYPGSDETQKIDERAVEILKVAIGDNYPENIRVQSARILIKTGDKETPFASLVNIVKNGKDLDSRREALWGLHKIGDDKSKKVVEESLKIKEIEGTAQTVLRCWDDENIRR